MFTKSFNSASLAGLFAFAVIASVMPASYAVPGADSVPEVKESNGITYVTGGIGDTEQAIFKGLRDEYNLRLTLAVKEGNYLNNVQVRVFGGGDNVLLHTMTEGPFLYAKLKPGNYVVEASHEGDVQTGTVQVDAAGSGEVTFVW